MRESPAQGALVNPQPVPCGGTRSNDYRALTGPIVFRLRYSLSRGENLGANGIKSVIVHLIVPYYMDNRGNSRANTC